MCTLTILPLGAHYVCRVGHILCAKGQETRQRRARRNTASGFFRRSIIRDVQRVACADRGLWLIVYISPSGVGGCHDAASVAIIWVQCYCMLRFTTA